MFELLLRMSLFLMWIKWGNIYRGLVVPNSVGRDFGMIFLIASGPVLVGRQFISDIGVGFIRVCHLGGLYWI